MPPSPRSSSSPSQSPAPKSQTLGIIIALAILCVVGFIVLYFKLDMDRSSRSDDVTRLTGRITELESVLTKQAATTTAVAPTPVEAQTYQQLATSDDGMIVMIGSGTCTDDFSISGPKMTKAGSEYNFGFRASKDVPETQDLGNVVVNGVQLTTNLMENGIVDGCHVSIGFGSKSTGAGDPLSFSTGTLNVHVTKTASVGYTLKLADLQGAGSECGHQQTDAHYQALIGKMAKANVVQYDITSNVPSQEPTFTIYAVQNVAGYTDIAAVKQDLDVCAAGGVYPAAVNAKWIMFEGPCGGASDSSKPAPMCGKIAETVSPTIKIAQ